MQTVRILRVALWMGLGSIADAQRLGHLLTEMAKMPCCWCATARPVPACCTEHAFVQAFSILTPYKGFLDAFLQHHGCLQTFESAIVCTSELVFQVVRLASASYRAAVALMSCTRILFAGWPANLWLRVLTADCCRSCSEWALSVRPKCRRLRSCASPRWTCRVT